MKCLQPDKTQWKFVSSFPNNFLRMNILQIMYFSFCLRLNLSAAVLLCFLSFQVLFVLLLSDHTHCWQDPTPQSEAQQFLAILQFWTFTVSSTFIPDIDGQNELCIHATPKKKLVELLYNYYLVYLWFSNMLSIKRFISYFQVHWWIGFNRRKRWFVWAGKVWLNILFWVCLCRAPSLLLGRNCHRTVQL